MYNTIYNVLHCVLYCAQVTIDEQFFHHSFVYPDFSAEQKDLQEFIAADLLEVSHKRALERSGEGCALSLVLRSCEGVWLEPVM